MDSSYAKLQQDCKAAEAQEQPFKEKIEKVWGVELRKDIRQKVGSRNMSFIDFMVIKPGTDIVMGYVEIKSATKNYKFYPDYVIDHSKMAKIRLKYLESNKPVYVATRFKDVDMVYEFNPTHSFKIEHKGRTIQKRSEYDQKEVEYIPMELFRKLDKIKWR